MRMLNGRLVVVRIGCHVGIKFLSTALHKDRLEEYVTRIRCDTGTLCLLSSWSKGLVGNQPKFCVVSIL